jgi:hypothetical protein
MLFKIRVRLTSGQRFIENWTDSIKVVAKLDSIRKKQAEIQGAQVPTRKNKRARADDLLDTLSNIQDQQRHQAELLNHLLVRMNSVSPYSPLPSSPPVSPSLSTPTLSLESAFQQFMEAYSQVDVSDRPTKMRKLIHGLPSDHKQDAEELGCVLADMTDSCSSKEEEHSLSQDSPPPQTPPTSNNNYGFTEEQMGDISSDCELISNMSNSDLENWNNVLHDFLVKDSTA